MTESESVALPLGDTPIFNLLIYYNRQHAKIQAFLRVVFIFLFKNFIVFILTLVGMLISRLFFYFRYDIIANRISKINISKVINYGDVESVARM